RLAIAPWIGDEKAVFGRKALYVHAAAAAELHTSAAENVEDVFVFGAWTVRQMEDAMLREAQTGVDGVPLDPGFKLTRRRDVRLGHELQRAIAQRFEAGQRAVGNPTIHQARNKFVELDQQHALIVTSLHLRVLNWPSWLAMPALVVRFQAAPRLRFEGASGPHSPQARAEER